MLSTDPPADGPGGDALESPEIRAWLAAARNGDRDAFGRLVLHYQRVVFRTVLAVLRTRDDAEDVAQEAFLVAWRKLGGFRGQSTFKTWMLTIAWRKALDRRRTRSLFWYRQRPALDDSGHDVLDGYAGEVPDPERSAMAADLARRTRAAIAGLSPKLRDTLLLAAAGEQTYEEIAAMLRVPVGTVKWRVAEARRLVRQRVGRSEQGEDRREK